MGALKIMSSRIGSFDCRWRLMGGSTTRPVAVFLPGGPGLSTEYLKPWGKTLSKTAGIDVALLEYPRFIGKTLPLPGEMFGSFKNALTTALGQLLRQRKNILIGHSFSCRLLLDLFRTCDIEATAAILMNCPAGFEASRTFAHRQSELDGPAVISTEADFRSFWKALHPLYFDVSPKNDWLKILTRNTYWTDSSWLTKVIQGHLVPGRFIRDLPMLFFHGVNDLRLPDANRITLKKLFPFDRHVTLARCGHFPMLEQPERLTQETILFLDEVGLRE